MDKYTSLLVVILLLMLLYYASEPSNSLSENYYNTSTKKQCNLLTKDIMSQSHDILLDPVFSNVIVYNNDDNPYVEGEQNGLDKCLENCDGKCIEFGITGIATCFPNKKY